MTPYEEKSRLFPGLPSTSLVLSLVTESRRQRPATMHRKGRTQNGHRNAFGSLPFTLVEPRNVKRVPFHPF